MNEITPTHQPPDHLELPKDLRIAAPLPPLPLHIRAQHRDPLGALGGARAKPPEEPRHLLSRISRPSPCGRGQRVLTEAARAQEASRSMDAFHRSMAMVSRSLSTHWWTLGWEEHKTGAFMGCLG